MSLFTIGHSNHPLEEFVELLRGVGVLIVADIRRFPASRHCPWFNEDALAASLAQSGIGYRRVAELGGRRGRSGIAAEVNGFWENVSFHHYADYALSPPFRQGLSQAMTLSDTRPTALMCAEAVWWRCHRRIVADHLLAQDLPVSHIMPDGRIEPARLTAGAVVGAGAVVTYPARY